jgi:hypothetical protein
MANNISASGDLMTHMKRELVQAILLLLLDERFLYAYEHGIEVLCGDGILRLLFPRFFTYSADYPEKYVYKLLFNFLTLFNSQLLNQSYPGYHTVSRWVPLPTLSDQEKPDQWSGDCR